MLNNTSVQHAQTGGLFLFGKSCAYTVSYKLAYHNCDSHFIVHIFVHEDIVYICLKVRSAYSKKKRHESK